MARTSITAPSCRTRAVYRLSPYYLSVCVCGGESAWSNHYKGNEADYNNRLLKLMLMR